MALVDSKAAFDVHCDNVDSTGWLKRMMHGNNLSCFSDLGYSISTPQNPPTEQEVIFVVTGCQFRLIDCQEVPQNHGYASQL